MAWQCIALVCACLPATPGHVVGATFFMGLLAPPLLPPMLNMESDVAECR